VSTLLRKIEEGEHQQQDFKHQITDSRKIARTLSAFANTDGGRLLIGVKDNGNISGVNSHEEIHMIEAAADFYSTPAIDVQYQHHKIGSKEILEAIVQPSVSKPHFVKEKEGKNVAYFRKNDENFPASGVLIKYWKYHKKEALTIEFKEKEEQLLTFLRENPYITVKRYAALAKVSFIRAEDLLATFMHWGIVNWHFNGKFFEYSLSGKIYS
jgi:predicted HTH transcriptional regulator